ncbi:membrane protein insertase YidC [Marinilongibacter aquaticus]|uniref:membrane protein insertase YidC n=1 Tax=Marinilongibacter aquaticus TaxID=2975157 RepID=UPI0021BDE126|nr:membrane protein insertase YidC [Marinilongibacter aquaticus]UBM59957.1 membrane protein insertase YidC [Marinilongibacter aquaticus]
MEKFDKNYIIGFILLFVMYGTYMYFYPATPAQQTEAAQEQVAAKEEVVKNTSANLPAPKDSAALAAQFGAFSQATQGTAQDVVLENENLKVTLSSKGGTVKQVELKKYKTYDDYIEQKSGPLVLMDEDHYSEIGFELDTQNGKLDLNDLYFQVDNASSNQVRFVLTLANGEKIEQTYSLPETGYALDYDLNLGGAGSAVKSSPIAFRWANKLKKLENDLKENRNAAQINLYETDEDFESFGKRSTKDIAEHSENPVSWFAFNQKYFTSGLVSEGGAMNNVSLNLITPEEDSSTVKYANVSGELTYQANNSMRFYFGPNEMNELKPVANGFHKNLYLGYDIVKPINRFVFVPLFNWLEQFISNYGLLIICVVLIIKTTLTPLLYKSYTSSAKMRLLAPEIAKIKEDIGDDQVKVQQETMNLYRQAGVSPLSGCVPMLLQMPILMSVFFLFPNMEMFRQKSFLWASDLSTYDAPISWAANLPVIGNHLSLFTVLMTLSSLAFTYYNNQITPAQQGPVDMRKLTYIFPIVFFFVLNDYPAALSFYYLVSNLVTIAQQLIVKRFVDEDKILAVLEENKRNYASKPKKKSKFAGYLEKQLQAQEEANRLKAKEQKRKKKS